LKKSLCQDVWQVPEQERASRVNLPLRSNPLSLLRYDLLARNPATGSPPTSREDVTTGVCDSGECVRVFFHRAPPLFLIAEGGPVVPEPAQFLSSQKSEQFNARPVPSPRGFQ
jgi:hypothetical protein